MTQRRVGRAALAAISTAGSISMPDFGFGRCDGHHEMVDLGLRTKQHCVSSAETATPAFTASFLFGRIVNSASRWSRLVAGRRPSRPHGTHSEEGRESHA